MKSTRSSWQVPGEFTSIGPDEERSIGRARLESACHRGPVRAAVRRRRDRRHPARRLRQARGPRAARPGGAGDGSAKLDRFANLHTHRPARFAPECRGSRPGGGLRRRDRLHRRQQCQTGRPAVPLGPAALHRKARGGQSRTRRSHRLPTEIRGRRGPPEAAGRQRRGFQAGHGQRPSLAGREPRLGGVRQSPGGNRPAGPRLLRRESTGRRLVGDLVGKARWQGARAQGQDRVLRPRGERQDRHHADAGRVPQPHRTAASSPASRPTSGAFSSGMPTARWFR